MIMVRIDLSYRAGQFLIITNCRTIFISALAALCGHCAAGDLHSAILIKAIAAGFFSLATNSYDAAAGDRCILHTATAGLSGSALCYHSAAAYVHRRHAEAKSTQRSTVSAGGFHRSASNRSLNTAHHNKIIAADSGASFQKSA